MPLFRKRKPDPIFVFAHINARVSSIDRGERFEDPLDVALKKAKVGEVTGGGCGFAAVDSSEINFDGVDIDLTDLDNGLPLVISTLEQLGAPKGSKLAFERDGNMEVIPFGKAEGIAIYLNGTDLPQDVYANSDVNLVIDRINELLDDNGVALDFWEGPTETALYLYGHSADQMVARLAEFTRTEPLCQKARIVRFA